MFIKRLLQTLQKHQVRYALVGGYAVALHGAIRGTVDIDLVVTLDEAEFVKLAQALAAIGLVSRLPIGPAEVFRFREEYIQNRNLIAWSFYNPANPLEVVDILITEDLRSLTTVTKKVGSLQVVVASIADLIRLKRKANRPQDIEDIKALERLL